MQDHGQTASEEAIAYAGRHERMNAAQMQAIKDAGTRMGQDIGLRQWCVQRAIEASNSTECVFNDKEIVGLADQIHRFITGTDQ